MKAFADRPQDQADTLGIARRRGRQLDRDGVIDRLTPLAAVKEAPGVLDRVKDLRSAYGP